MPALRRTKSERWSPENGPISSSLIAIRPRLTRNLLAERRFWRPGSPERRSSAVRLALHRLSAGNENRRGQHLRQLFRRLSRRVPQVERHTSPPSAVEEAGDRGIAIGPIPGEHLHASGLERVTNFGAVDGGGFVDFARQAPVRGEIDEQRPALLNIARDAGLAPRFCAGNRMRRRGPLRN